MSLVPLPDKEDIIINSNYLFDQWFETLEKTYTHFEEAFPKEKVKIIELKNNVLKSKDTIVQFVDEAETFKKETDQTSNHWDIFNNLSIFKGLNLVKYLSHPKCPENSKGYADDQLKTLTIMGTGCTAISEKSMECITDLVNSFSKNEEIMKLVKSISSGEVEMDPQNMMETLMANTEAMESLMNNVDLTFIAKELTENDSLMNLLGGVVENFKNSMSFDKQ